MSYFPLLSVSLNSCTISHTLLTNVWYTFSCLVILLLWYSIYVCLLNWKVCRLPQANCKVTLISEKSSYAAFTYIQIIFCFDFNSNNISEGWCLWVMLYQIQFFNGRYLFCLLWLHFESSLKDWGQKQKTVNCFILLH